MTDTEARREDNALLHEIRGMREDFRDVSVKVERLTTQMESVAKVQDRFSDHAERLTKIETRMESAEKQVKNNQWVIGLLVALVLGLLATASQHWK